MPERVPLSLVGRRLVCTKLSRFLGLGRQWTFPSRFPLWAAPIFCYLPPRVSACWCSESAGQQFYGPVCLSRRLALVQVAGLTRLPLLQVVSTTLRYPQSFRNSSLSYYLFQCDRLIIIIQDMTLSLCSAGFRLEHYWLLAGLHISRTLDERYRVSTAEISPPPSRRVHAIDTSCYLARTMLGFSDCTRPGSPLAFRDPRPA